MPKRTDIDSILVIGAGPIVIGQACEFDYSGTQAIRALKEEGYRVILLNSNPATIMTDPALADATYIEPITPEVVEKIIEREKPDALLPTMGGQTALNTALTCEREGILARHGVKMIGANADVIDKAEDRELFRKAMEKIGLDLPRSAFVNVSELKRRYREEYAAAIRDIEERHPQGAERDCALKEFEERWQQEEWIRREEIRLEAMRQTFDAFRITGLPAIVRPSFTLGGTGGGIAYTLEELYDIALNGIEASPTSEVLIEESVLGWKEYEMEVVRDKDDNCIIVCSIENVDPMGVHTGDSITVAPALTLTDREYQRMRNAAIAVLREIGVETGGSNVQFAVNPKDGRMVVIEMNPRVSRSSALASKATGFPIARVAAKLAIGYTLDELDNAITKGATPASFEPTIDYVVTKVPRFAFEKFPGAEPVLGTSMKSVGEAMAIGRTFHESLQKALRSLETGLTGLNEVEIEGLGEEDDDRNAIRAALSKPAPDRLLKMAQALRLGFPVDDVVQWSGYDRWFVERLAEIVDMEERVKAHGLPEDAANFRRLKAMGFSDARLAELSGLAEEQVRQRRWDLDVRPVFKRIDTCAAEFASPTAYMYSTYDTGIPGLVDGDEARVSERRKVVILGGGPNRIGQGIEFDYCCCHASFALKEEDIETIMVNCNPETVSTDFDTSDRLYFEPLTTEDVLEILLKEREKGELLGVIVQFGGQTPLKLSHAILAAGIPILGTQPDAIDLAEDRDRFAGLLRELGLKQPENGIARSAEEAREIAGRIGFPVVIRPSYVLGGRAMEIVRDAEQLQRYISEAVIVSGDSPVLIDRYLEQATEVDVDVLADGEMVHVAGIMEHIEEAGVHSGDSACSLPPHELAADIVAEIVRQSEKLARALHVRGLMNVQFAVKEGVVYILEVNPRASRTVPFVAKATGDAVAAIGAKVMAGRALADFGLKPRHLNHVSVKEAVFPFNRFPGVDTLLGPEMRSTGEVMGIDTDFPMAYAKAQLAAGQRLPRSGTVFISVRDADKPAIVEPARLLHELGFTILATGGTQRYLTEHGVPARRINKVLEGRPHIVDAMANGEVQLVFNTTEGAAAVRDSRSIRQQAIFSGIPYATTVAGARAVALAIRALLQRPLEVRSLQEYIAARAA